MCTIDWISNAIFTVASHKVEQEKKKTADNFTKQQIYQQICCRLSRSSNATPCQTCSHFAMLWAATGFTVRQKCEFLHRTMSNMSIEHWTRARCSRSRAFNFMGWEKICRTLILEQTNRTHSLNGRKRVRICSRFASTLMMREFMREREKTSLRMIAAYQTKRTCFAIHFSF